jgi:predicted transcriptional regulator
MTLTVKRAVSSLTTEGNNMTNTLQAQIISLLHERHWMDAEQITIALNAKKTSVKVILNKLIKLNKLERKKELRDTKTHCGPQNTYRYKAVEV